jgi:Patatin-like phospholipase
MSVIFKNIFYSLPVQLFILHFRKYQVLLIFWYALFSALASGFMKTFGADALFFSPEYLGTVNMLAAFITGLALGVFIMCWNITTFILHSKRLKFLATTSSPFLKYCINNFLFPLLLLIFYCVRLYYFDFYKELMSNAQILKEIVGLLFGVFTLILFSFAYFFGAGKTIERAMAPIIMNPQKFNSTYTQKDNRHEEFGLKVNWYLSTGLKIRKPRNVAHYRQDFLDSVFKRHHLAAIAAIMIAFIVIVITGFFQDNKYFEIPAAASILTVFALLVAVIGAVTYFLQSWSLPAVIILLLGLNYLYKQEIIDPRNKAYGLKYSDKKNWPTYNKHALQQLCTIDKLNADRANMITILNNWKAKQQDKKPLMVIMNVSGGGLRSATFTMNVLQKTDSLCGGNLMKKTVLITGASGGMLAAAYYRELYNKKLKDSSLEIYNSRYTENIAKDILNPVFTSLMARDVLAPAQKFKVGNNSYVKDRGYAFEKKLNKNADNLFNKQMKDLQADEHAANIPLIIFNSVIKSDARKMMISTQPISFMMKPFATNNDSAASPDAVDFSALFANQNPMDLRMLTALRMNATFPYVLPNVWMPTTPVIDVMDAGLRDNYGQETAMRFIDNFKDWISENTSGVLLVQIRDRLNDNWQQPFETNSITDMIVTPATMLQNNFFKLQEYYQTDQFNYFNRNTAFTIHKSAIMYISENVVKSAALNFHLTGVERKDVIASFNNPINQKEVKRIAALVK